MTDENKQTKFKVGDKVSFKLHGVLLIGKIKQISPVNKTYLIEIQSNKNVCYILEENICKIITDEEKSDEDFETDENKQTKFKVGDTVSFLLGNANNNVTLDGTITSMDQDNATIDIKDGKLIMPLKVLLHKKEFEKKEPEEDYEIVEEKEPKKPKEPKFKVDDMIVSKYNRNYLITACDKHRHQYITSELLCNGYDNSRSIINGKDEDKFTKYVPPFKVGDTIYQNDIPVIVKSMVVKKWRWKIEFEGGKSYRCVCHSKFLREIKTQKQYDDKWKSCKFKYGDVVTNRFEFRYTVIDYSNNFYVLDDSLKYNEDELVLYVEPKFKVGDMATIIKNKKNVIIKNINGDNYVCNDYHVYKLDELKLYESPIKVGDSYYDNLKNKSEYNKNTIMSVTNLVVDNEFTLKIETNYYSVENDIKDTEYVHTGTYTDERFLSIYYTESQFQEIIKLDNVNISNNDYTSDCTVIKMGQYTFIKTVDQVTDMKIGDNYYKLVE
jgi:hypothetical protein